MPATPINWNLYHYNQVVVEEVDEAIRWMSAECPTSKKILDTQDFREKVASEMDKMKRIDPKPYLRYALYQLYLDGFIKNPLNLTRQNIDDAIWATNKPNYGIVSKASTTKLGELPFKRFQL